MIAVLQFDSVSLPMLDNLMQQGQLPAIAKLRQRGHWYKLDTAASSFEGATHYTLYSGRHVSDHGIYFPFIWSSASQRVEHRNNLQTPEPVWDRIGRAGRRSLVIDPYEAKPPQSLQGAGLGGWQFRHKITLHSWSLPRGLARLLEHRFGAPPSVEEVYGRPSLSDLARMREVLTTAPHRLADTVLELIRREEFDLVWVTLSSWLPMGWDPISAVPTYSLECSMPCSREGRSRMHRILLLEAQYGVSEPRFPQASGLPSPERCRNGPRSSSRPVLSCAGPTGRRPALL